MILKIFITIISLTFLFITYRSAYPVPSQKLNTKYYLCHLVNLQNWESLRITPKSTKYDFDQTLKKSYYQFIFTNLQDNPFTPVIKCKFNIPVSILYKSEKLKTLIAVNQSVSINLSFYRFGQGPMWEPIEIISQDLDKPILLSRELDENLNHKLNWLSGDYEEVAFQIEKYDHKKELIIRFYETYLE